MGREVRMVPADWEHPKLGNGELVPLLGGTYREAKEAYLKEKRRWEDEGAAPGEEEVPEGLRLGFSEWYGPPPAPQDYMPSYLEGAATHYMMYETCTEGTPISPGFPDPESLARWLADNKASAFGDMTATYDQWLVMIREGDCVSAAITSDGMISGPALMKKVVDDKR